MASSINPFCRKHLAEWQTRRKAYNYAWLWLQTGVQGKPAWLERAFSLCLLHVLEHVNQCLMNVLTSA